MHSPDTCCPSGAGRLALSLSLAVIAGVGGAVGLTSQGTADIASVHQAVPPTPPLGVVPGLMGGEIVTVTFQDHPVLPVVAELELEGEPVTLELATHSVRSPDYKVLVQGADGSFAPAAPSPVNTLRGAIAGRPGTEVVGGTMDGELLAMIRIETGERLWLEPMSHHVEGAAAGQYVLYRDGDVIDTGGTCGFIGGMNDGPDPDADPKEPAFPEGLQNECTDLGIDSDWEYYVRWGSSVTNVENRINLVNNIMNNQYEDEVDITHLITIILVRTSDAADPYTSTDAGTLLNQFGNWWNNNFAIVGSRDVAQLFTNKQLQGFTIGIAAGLGLICVWTQAYCLVQSDFNNILSCATDLSAHELGHLWNANHCSCTSHTMNPSITCSNQFHPTFTIPEIINHRNSRTCLVCPIIVPNDNCEDAQPIPLGVPRPFTTEGATTDGPPQSDCGATTAFLNDVWFNVLADCDGVMTVDVCDADFNTKLVVYPFTGACPPDAASAIVCDDNGCGQQSTVTFDAVANTVYSIRIGGAGGTMGGGSLTTSLECVSDPCLCDFDDNDVRNVDDLLFLLASWGDTAGDCNDDGTTNVDDLLFLLAGWGPCP